MKVFKHVLSVLFFWIVCSANINAEQKLSDQAEMSLLTCGAGDDLYSVFGHSAIRVNDPVLGVDVVFNYGTFNFDAPNFYLNFARGKLNYILSVSSFKGFMRGYHYEERYVIEQVLSLSSVQKQALFNALINNHKPENREYLYDFFYDNCSTRIRDILMRVLGDQLDYRLDDAPKNDMSFRDYVDANTFNVPWGDLGIDLALGLPTDKMVTPFHRMFLPEEMKMAFNRAVIINDVGEVRSLVSKERMLLDLPPRSSVAQWGTPLQLFWVLAVLYLLYWRKSPRYAVLERSVYTVVGLVGVLMVLLWFATDHTATAWNFNLLWSFPTWLILAAAPLRSKMYEVVRRMHRVLLIAVLLGWFFWPQDLHSAVVPLSLLLFLSTFDRFKSSNKTQNKAVV